MSAAAAAAATQATSTGGMLRATCGDFCQRCHNWFYVRPDAFRQIFWVVNDITRGIHYGIEFVPTPLTLVVALSILVVCFPEIYRDFSWRSVGFYVKTFCKLLIPLMVVQYIWRPLNYGIKYFFFKYLHLTPCDYPGLILPPLASMLLASALIGTIYYRFNPRRKNPDIVLSSKSSGKLAKSRRRSSARQGRGVRSSASARNASVRRSRSRSPTRSRSRVAGLSSSSFVNAGIVRKARDSVSGEIIDVMQIKAKSLYADAASAVPHPGRGRAGDGGEVRAASSSQSQHKKKGVFGIRKKDVEASRKKSKGRVRSTSPEEERFEKGLIRKARSKSRQGGKGSKGRGKSAKARKSGRRRGCSPICG